LERPDLTGQQLGAGRGAPWCAKISVWRGGDLWLGSRLVVFVVATPIPL
jgi:hypothetical protein